MTIEIQKTPCNLYNPYPSNEGLRMLNLVMRIENECDIDVQNYPGGFPLEKILVCWVRGSAPNAIELLDPVTSEKLNGTFEVLGSSYVISDGVATVSVVPTIAVVPTIPDPVPVEEDFDSFEYAYAMMPEIEPEIEPEVEPVEELDYEEYYLDCDRIALARKSRRGLSHKTNRYKRSKPRQGWKNHY